MRGSQPVLSLMLLLGTVQSFAHPSRAESTSGAFAGFFAFAPEPARLPTGSGIAETALSADDDCIRAIRQAERRFDLPDNLLMAIGLQEAGVRRGGAMTIWPWSVNSEGTGFTFASRREAMDFVKAEQALGKSSIDIGCLQVNLRWHPDAFSSLEQGFNPQRNADYAAAFLRRLYEESGDWAVAVGNYHSRTPVDHARYLAGVEANMAFVAGLEEGPPQPGASGAAQEESLDDVLRAFAGDREGDATPKQPGSVDPGWGARGTGGRSIYSAHPIQPVLSGLASFPDA